MAGKEPVRLGGVQETLFIPLAARARETQRRHPILRDPRAVELVQSINYDTAKYGRGAGGFATVLRTAIFDLWARAFLADHPAGTVTEIGTGLNTRFDRVDNGQVHWIDLDLPDTIELRRRFFTDTSRRTMLAASFLDEDWLAAVADRPGPYFFAAEGVLVYLPEQQVTAALARLAQRFPGALIALDTYPRATYTSASWPPGRTSRRGGSGPSTIRAPSSASACTSSSPPPSPGRPPPCAASSRPGSATCSRWPTRSSARPSA